MKRQQANPRPPLLFTPPVGLIWLVQSQRKQDVMLELERLQDATKLRSLACKAFEVIQAKTARVIRSRLTSRSGPAWAEMGRPALPPSPHSRFVRVGAPVFGALVFAARARAHAHTPHSQHFPASAGFLEWLEFSEHFLDSASVSRPALASPSSTSSTPPQPTRSPAGSLVLCARRSPQYVIVPV